MDTTAPRPGGDLLVGMDAARRPTGPVIAVLIVLAALVVGQGVLGLPLELAFFGSTRPANTGGLGYQFFSTFVLFGLTTLMLYLWIRFKEARPFPTVGFRSRPAGAGYGALAGLVMFAVIVGGGFAAGQFTFLPWPGGGPVNAGLIGGALLALVGFAVQGSTEEIMTRGFLMQAGARKWGLVAGVALQAVVFALLHGLNPGGFALVPIVNLVLVALFLAGWALLEGGLWGVCAWHAVWNWTQGNVWGLLVSGLRIDTSLLQTRAVPGSSDVLTGGPFGPEGGVLTTVVLLIGIAVLYALHRRRGSLSPR